MAKTGLFDRSEDVESYAAGEPIFHKGDAAGAMYVVVAGTVAIGAKDAVIDRVEAGSLFGEMALIDDAPRSADAWAETDVRLVPIGKERFEKLVRQTPQFALQVMSVMAERLRRLIG